MNTVKVAVGGKDYTISTSDSTAHVYNLARTYDKKLKDFMNANKGASQYTASVFVGLSILDDLSKARENSEQIFSEAKSYVDDAGKIRMENDSLKKENDSLRVKLYSALEEIEKINRKNAKKS